MIPQIGTPSTYTSTHLEVVDVFSTIALESCEEATDQNKTSVTSEKLWLCWSNFVLARTTRVLPRLSVLVTWQSRLR